MGLGCLFPSISDCHEGNFGKMKRLWLILFIFFSSLLVGQQELGSFPIINSDNIYLYSKPNTKSKKIQKTKYPSFIIAFDTLKNNMMKVNYKGQIGWLDIASIRFSGKMKLEIANKMMAESKNSSLQTETKPLSPPQNDISTKKKIELRKKPKSTNKISESKLKVTKKVVQKTETTPKKVIENDSDSSGVFILLILLIVVLIGALIKILPNYIKIRKKYLPIIDIDEALEKSQKELKTFKKSSERDMEKMKADYKVKKDIYSSLIAEVNKLSDNLEMMDYGMYEPQFDFDTSEDYKNKIKSIKEEQKQIIRLKKAVIVHREWSVDGSRAKGRTMENRAVRLTLRAFNGEADGIMAKVRWSNFESSNNRLNKSREMIDKLNESNSLSISRKFMNLKLKELHAIHEYNEKKQEEKEERKERLAEEREEKKVLLEAKRAKEKAEKEQAEHEKALEIARKELGLLSGEELNEKNSQIEKLEEQLREALENKERAMSMAQLTKQGHVYVISNIGSFGEGIYKIGLTRRLEPKDRVRELGDASVPFIFDLHAMIFSEDAPALEKQLHKVFQDKRVNMVNNRKEFFRVSLDAIEEEALKVMPDVEFYKTTESREYRETLSLLQSKEEKVAALEQQEDKFPDSI